MSLFQKESKKGVDYIKQKYGVTVKPVDAGRTVEYLFSVYDVICGEYNPPFVCKNLPTAIRNMRDSLKDAKQSIIAMHPEDYVLVQIGTFDKETGVVSYLDDVNRLSYPLVKLFAPAVEEKKVDEIQNK
nr:MAG TPA: DNA binding protein [Microviridae sp.]